MGEGEDFYGSYGFIITPRAQQASAGSDAPGRVWDALHLCPVASRPPTRPLQRPPGDTKPSHSGSHSPPYDRSLASAHPSSPNPSLVESQRASQHEPPPLRESQEDAKMLNKLWPAAKLCIIFLIVWTVSKMLISPRLSHQPN